MLHCLALIAIIQLKIVIACPSQKEILGCFIVRFLDQNVTSRQKIDLYCLICLRTMRKQWSYRRLPLREPPKEKEFGLLNRGEILHQY